MEQKNVIKDKWRTGQGLVEYSLVIALVAMMAIVAVRDLNIQRLFSAAESELKVAPGLPSGSNAYCTGSTTSLNGWNLAGEASGSWTVSDGRLCMDNKNRGGNYAYNACSQSGKMPDNSDYTVKVDEATLNSGHGYAVMFRMQDNSTVLNGYSFQYDPGANGLLFKKWVDGREYWINGKFPIGYQWTGQPRDVTVTVKGDQMYAYIDGELVLQGSDSTYNSGGAGLRTWWDTSACFSGFSVLPAP